ncbi:hypothetical protein KJ657_00350 [Patescibacteria group bacterium]|nr:hypothetical protein [Patescibacteria group bacterium]MBU1015527.1 hypothetical protein [Patescibacteria group bacterium]MBU1685645.1 hypothetical protein [Patescibacteria group bacterium]MBU1938138.1 hypothetical protein [Patescibacteria group bacterium]
MRKVVYIEIDEEVTAIYDRVKRAKQKDIFLVVPRKAILFQSVVNLRILKSKLEKDNKKLHLVTTDRIGIHLAQQADIPVYHNIEVEEIKAPDQDTPKMRIEPIQARRNEILKDIPKRVMEKKITIGELIREYRDSKKKSKKGGSTELAGVYNYVRPNRRFLGFILAISLVLFLIITYIALPGATVYVKPKFDNIEYTVNITLADKRKNQTLLSRNEPHVVASEEIMTVTKQTKIFNTTSKLFDGVNAQGFIAIINNSDDEWPLKKETRFQTDDGLIFRIKEGVFVPPKTVNEAGVEVPGTYTAAVEADPFDIYDHPIGERGNIGPGKFIIPGLSEFNRKLLWGESSGSMEGGITRYQQVVQKEDIEAAKKQIEDNLTLMAREDLSTHIDEMNRLNHTNLVLLDDSRYLKTKLQELRISDDLEGSLRDKFEIFAQIEAKGIAYDFDQLFSILKKELKTRTHPDMQIRDESIQPESVSFEAVSEDEVLGQVKITATIKGIQEYVIDSSLQAGLRFSNKLKERIVGLTVEEAENYVGNLPEVDAVEIKLWPIWLSRIPRIADNIEVKLMEN